MKYIVLFISVFLFNCDWNWKCFPVPYVISIDNSKFPIEIISNAVEYWNDSVDEELFLIDGPGQIEIWESDNVVCGDVDNAEGCAYPIVERGKIRRCIIVMRTIRGPLAEEVLAHELGHCVGLPHSDPENSIMTSAMNHNIDLLEVQYEHILSCMDE